MWIINFEDFIIIATLDHGLGTQMVDFCKTDLTT